MDHFSNAKVQVKQGWLQGYTEGELKIFKGIPYAAPPVGELRFRHPQDPGRWRGVRKATQYSSSFSCPWSFSCFSLLLFCLVACQDP